MVALPSIESSFVTHMAKGFTGFQHPDWPALRVAAEVLNATESYLWVRPLKIMPVTKCSPNRSTERNPRFRSGIWSIRLSRPRERLVQLLVVQGALNLWLYACSSNEHFQSLRLEFEQSGSV